MWGRWDVEEEVEERRVSSNLGFKNMGSGAEFGISWAFLQRRATDGNSVRESLPQRHSSLGK